MANPDIKLLIGAKGGESPTGDSAVRIRQELQAALGGNNGVKVNVRLASNAANNLRQEIQKALNANGGIEVKIKGQIAGAMSRGTLGSGGGKQKSSELSEIDSAYKALTDIEKRIHKLQIDKIKLNPKVNVGQIAALEKEISAAAQKQTELNTKADELKTKYPQLVEQSKAYANYQASKAMGAMTSSAGAMSSANSVYMESVGAKADRMKASFQEFASTLLDSDIVGLLYDIGNGALNAVSAFDAWPAKIALVAAGLPTLIGLFRELRHMPLIESIGGSFKDLARPKMTGRNWNWANHLEEAA